MRILYLSPDSDKPTGGIKVIYRHVELLRRCGLDAHVLHFGEGFRCSWFANDAPIVAMKDLRPSDLVVLPELHTVLANRLHGMGIRYAMFVQNAYLVLPTAPLAELRSAYRNAVAVLSISDDSSAYLSSFMPELAPKLLRVRYSIDTQRFKPATKGRVATYMPRKLPLHSANVSGWLSGAFPDWSFLAIHDKNETEVAEMLAGSRVFLAFSDFEGLPVPPVEAALSGNVVLGYPGWGGREYWREPNFRAADFGDMRDFARKFYEVADFALRDDAADLLAPGMAQLQQEFSEAAEKEQLLAAITQLQQRL